LLDRCKCSGGYATISVYATIAVYANIAVYATIVRYKNHFIIYVGPTVIDSGNPLIATRFLLSLKVLWWFISSFLTGLAYTLS